MRATLSELLGRVTWPPPDTDRNRFLFRLTFPLAGVAAVYVMAFAIASDGLLPYVVSVILLVVALMAGIGLLLMRAQRQEMAAAEAAELQRAGLRSGRPGG